MESWYNGLEERLRDRGFDAATARMVANHVRKDWLPFMKMFVRDKRVDETKAEDAFEEVFLTGDEEA